MNRPQGERVCDFPDCRRAPHSARLPLSYSVSAVPTLILDQHHFEQNVAALRVALDQARSANQCTDHPLLFLNQHSKSCDLTRPECWCLWHLARMPRSGIFRRWIFELLCSGQGWGGVLHDLQRAGSYILPLWPSFSCLALSDR